jgi:hypothetical protein
MSDYGSGSSEESGFIVSQASMTQNMKVLSHGNRPEIQTCTSEQGSDFRR